MNSADQGVSPLDTAFKRRWNFKYVGINDSERELQKCRKVANFWNNIRKEINNKLLSLGVNEDKLMGPFFIKPDDGMTRDEFFNLFANKVLLYLFEDAAKLKRNSLFKKNSFSVIVNDFKTAFKSASDVSNEGGKESNKIVADRSLGVFTFNVCDDKEAWPFSDGDNSIEAEKKNDALSTPPENTGSDPQ